MKPHDVLVRLGAAIQGKSNINKLTLTIQLNILCSLVGGLYHSYILYELYLMCQLYRMYRCIICTSCTICTRCTICSYQLYHMYQMYHM